MSKHSAVLLKYFPIAIILIVGIAVPKQPLASPIENAIDMLGASGTVDVVYGDHTVNSTLLSGADNDVYRFSGTAGDSVSVAVTGQAYRLDARIEVRDPSGALINDQSCNAGSASTCSVTALTTLPSTGAYTATVSDLALTNSGDYTMHIDQYPPVSNWLKVGYDTPMSEQLGHLADFDAYAFDAVAGSLVRLAAEGTAYRLDMLLEAFSPEGGLLDSASCDAGSASTCSTFLDITITDTGLHSFLVADLGNLHTGGYNFSVTCISSDCDGSTVIPVPPAVWLFGSGLIGLVGVARSRGKVA